MYFKDEMSVLFIKKWKMKMNVINRQSKFKLDCFERSTEKLIILNV